MVAVTGSETALVVRRRPIGAGVKTKDVAAAANRTRKAHRKSRLGCGNCKLRRVKCDEAKPCCKQCLSYGVACSYDRTTAAAADMQLTMTGVFKLDLSPTPTLDEPIDLPVAGPRGSPMYRLNPQDRALIDKFQNLTINTLGTNMSTSFFKRNFVSIGLAHPFLLHVILALTLIHEEYLLQDSHSPQKNASLALHWYHGAALFNARLSEPIRDAEKDALWSAAAMLGTSAFCDVRGARTPLEAWPMTPPALTDLDWVRLNDGKHTIMQHLLPVSKDSAFAELAIHMRSAGGAVFPLEKVGPEVWHLPPKLARLCGLTADSTIETNPYHSTGSILAQLMPDTCSRATIMRFLSFTGHRDPRFLALLIARDPAALMLQCYWYAKLVGYDQWWVVRRAMLEGPAIILYLRQSWDDFENFRDVLEFPKTVFQQKGCKYL